MTVETSKTPEKSQHALGRDAAQGDVELGSLCTWPSREYLESYFATRYGDHALGTILAAVTLNVELWKLRDALDAVHQVPRDVLYALAHALDHSGLRSGILDYCKDDVRAAKVVPLEGDDDPM